MEIKDHYYLGKLLKPVGIQGRMLLFLDVDDPFSYKNLDAAFVYIGGNLVPFIIDDIRIRKDKQAEVKLQDIDDAEQCEILTGAPVYLPLSVLPQLSEDQFYYHEITGFKVIDKTHGEIGTVENVLDYPLQALLQVMKGRKEILIPVADEIILSVDRNKRTLHIQAPEGLIEMYLE